MLDFSKKNKVEVQVEDQLSDDEIVQRLINFITSRDQIAKYNLMERGSISKDAYMESIKEYVLSSFKMSDEQFASVWDKFTRYMWSYYVIDDLIKNPDIWDIRILAYDKVWVSENGEWRRSEVSFRSQSDYERFFEKVITKNHVNLSDNNANQTFMDNDNNEDWNLRFTVTSRFITEGAPYIYIRKEPKKKLSLDELIAKGMLDEKTRDMLVEKATNNESLIICGRTGSGKTVLMNALLECIPAERVIHVIQKNEEIFALTDRQIMLYHTIENKGDGKISYDLSYLAGIGLQLGVETFITGEITGDEARDFGKAAHTGSAVWGSLHADSPEDAMIRLCDYFRHAAPEYSEAEIKFMFRNVKNIVYMSKFKVRNLSELEWDKDKKDFIYRKVGGV